MSDDVVGINQLRERYEAACNAGDLRAYANALTDDVKFMPPDGPTVAGKEACVAWVKTGFLDPFNVRFRSKFDDVQVFGSQAFASGSFGLEMTPKAGGKKIEGTGKFMNILRKQADGSWKYAQAIFNYDKPPA